MYGSSGAIQRTSYLSTEQSDSHCVSKKSSPCLLLLLFARTWQTLWRRRYCGTRAGRMCQRLMQSFLTIVASPPCTSSGHISFSHNASWGMAFLRPLWNVTLAPSIFSLSFFEGGNLTKSQQQHVPRQTLYQIRSFNETELRLHVAGSGSAPCKSVLNTEPRLHLLCICFPRAWNMQTSSTSVNVLEQKKVLLKLCVIFQIFLEMFLKAAIKKQ